MNHLNCLVAHGNNPCNCFDRSHPNELLNGIPIREGLCLTKREWFAGMALNGIVASDREFDDIISHAFKIADAMLAQEETK